MASHGLQAVAQYVSQSVWGISKAPSPFPATGVSHFSIGGTTTRSRTFVGWIISGVAKDADEPLP